MPRPEFVTNESIARWSENIDNDSDILPELINNPIIREVCYAGLWLCEELYNLGCPEEMIVRIQFSAGRYSFGRDPWEAHQLFLNSYKRKDIQFEKEPSELN